MIWNNIVYKPSGLISLGSAPSGYDHGDPLVINGSSFGTKSPAAPLVWDDCNHSQSIGTRWEGYSPSSSGGDYDLDYYVPNTGTVPNIALPHSNAGTKVMAGCHYPHTGSDEGYNVGPIKTIPWSNGQPVYAYYLYRLGPNFDEGDPENHKMVYWDGSSPGWYSSSTDGYVEWKFYGDNSPHWNWNESYSYVGTDDLGNTGGNALGQPDSTPNPFTTWRFHEHFVGLSTTGSAGFHYVIDGNEDRDTGDEATYVPSSGNIRLQNVDPDKCVFFYHESLTPSGLTDSIHMGIGGYAREGSADEYRFYADLYIDNTWSRVVLTDNATYASATEVVPQIPTAWSASQITVTVNKGRLATGTAHVWVFDSANARQYLGTVELN